MAVVDAKILLGSEVTKVDTSDFNKNNSASLSNLIYQLESTKHYVNEFLTVQILQKNLDPNTPIIEDDEDQIDADPPPENFFTVTPKKLFPLQKSITTTPSTDNSKRLSFNSENRRRMNLPCVLDDEDVQQLEIQAAELKKDRKKRREKFSMLEWIKEVKGNMKDKKLRKYVERLHTPSNSLKRTPSNENLARSSESPNPFPSFGTTLIYESEEEEEKEKEELKPPTILTSTPKNNNYNPKQHNHNNPIQIIEHKVEISPPSSPMKKDFRLTQSESNLQSKKVKQLVIDLTGEDDDQPIQPPRAPALELHEGDQQQQELILSDEDFHPEEHTIDDAVNEHGDSLLHFAVQNLFLEMTMHLLSKGADINAKNDNGDTVLHTLCGVTYNDVKISKIAQVLLEHGCEKNAMNKNGNTALHICALNDNLKLAILLLKNSANPLAKNNRIETPLIVATMKASLKVMKLLIKYGDEVNPGGFALSHYAALSGSKEALILALNEFPDQAFAFTTTGQTPLHFSCQVGNTFQVEYLLSLKGIDKNAKNKWKETPFFIAVREQKLECAKLLKEAKVKTDDMDYMEITPLMIATSKGNLKLVQFLIEECTSGISGTSIFAETKDGNSIFAIAKRFQYSSIIDYLHKFNVESDVAVSSSRTPWWLSRWAATALLVGSIAIYAIFHQNH